ncbi:MAG: hypothetical protein HY662_02615 [Chloroflexi bacterium]|nr:hypothetical protein [Chloroflexota bacterium]
MAKIFECEHHPGDEVVIRLRPPLKSLSPDAREHFIRAQKELLLSFRSVIDALIELAEAAETKTPTSKRTKVKID